MRGWWRKHLPVDPACGRHPLHDFHEHAIMVSLITAGARMRTMESVRASLTTVCAESTQEKESTMWTKPEATEMRFGFEVTMYVCNR